MEPPPETVASWQDAAYRCPRPGFFAGDDFSVFPSFPSSPPSPPRRSPLSNDTVLLDADALPPSWHLGRLGVLPLELLHEIAAHVAATDVAALVALRNCNRAAAAVVDSVRDFAAVAAFPRALGALVRLAPRPQAISHPGGTPPPPATVSLQAMAACLRSTACASCLRQRRRQRASETSKGVRPPPDNDNDDDSVPYGDCIYLLTPERVCYACFRSRPEYLPVARFVAGGDTATTTTPPLPAEAAARLCTLTSIRVPPGRYGVLTRLGQPVELFDRRQVYGEVEEEEEGEATEAVTADGRTVAAARLAKHTTMTTTTVPARPEALRYAAVIPGPYWDVDAATGDYVLDRGYACRACAQTDCRGAGWADPLARYTRAGLQRHLADAALGGGVLAGGDARWPGVAVFRHAGPRRGRFAAPAEFGATADLARRYEALE